MVEMQGEWIAAALTGSLRFPPVERMWPAIDRAERRTRKRFPKECARGIRCDPHAYRRLLHQDLRRARWRRLRTASSELNANGRTVFQSSHSVESDGETAYTGDAGA